jgi:hypothetical protein
MKKFSLLLFLLLVFTSVLFFQGGCNAKRTDPAFVYVPDATPVLAGVDFTHSTVMGGVTDVRLNLQNAVEASKGLPSEAAVREAARNVEEALTRAEEALKAHPPEEVKELIAALNTAIDQLREIIKQRDKEIQQLKDANARTWHWILYGGGVLFTVFAVTSGFFSSSIPVLGLYLGPRIGLLCGAIAGTLFVLGYLYDWTREHPVWTAAGVTLLLGGALGLAWANQVQHDHERKTNLPNLNLP